MLQFLLLLNWTILFKDFVVISLFLLRGLVEMEKMNAKQDEALNNKIDEDIKIINKTFENKIQVLDNKLKEKMKNIQ